MRSLNVRLLLGAALWTAGLLLCAAVIARERLRSHLEDRYRDFLSLQLDELAIALALDSSGTPFLTQPLSDRRFATVASGLSWEVRDGARTVLASPSQITPNPRRAALDVSRSVTSPARFQLVLHADREIVEAGELFLNSLASTFLLAIAAALLAGGALTVQRTLRTFGRLRARLAAVRGGGAARLHGSYPSEIQPLVDDLNSLLQHNESSIARATQQAGNLAHALKTPLAIIANEAFDLTSAGDGSSGRAIASQVRLMEERVGTYLARARAAASGQGLGARSEVHAALDGVLRVMRRLHPERSLGIEAGTSSAAFRGQQHDLEEMLGNLIDNACKWARDRVSLACAVRGERIAVTVDDDGPGMTPDERDALLLRAVRHDIGVPAAGYGFTIVYDLAQAYGGSLELSESPLGGLRATLLLPAAGA